MKTSSVFVVTLVFALNAAAADALTENLQRGLFEEEANHNLDAAIKEYQSVVSQSDEQRKVMATALFRLGECYRKLSRTNEANVQYQRILRDFSEQDQLVRLVNDLAIPTARANPSDYTRDLQRQIWSLRIESIAAREEASRLAQMTTNELAQSDTAKKEPRIVSLEQQLQMTEQKLATLQGRGLGETHPDVVSTKELRDTILKQRNAALAGLIVNAQSRAASLASQLSALQAELKAAETSGSRISPASIPMNAATDKLLREEITLAEQQVRYTELKLNAGKSTLDELLRVKQDVLRLKRMLPDNSSPTQQKALLEEQITIVQKLLNETQRRLEVGILAPGEDVPLKRELLALQRELSVVSDVATSFGATAPESSMTQAESEALARAKTLARNSPDLLQNPTREGLGELQLGARDGFYSVVEFILSQGVSANGPERGTPPIVLAAGRGHLRIVQLLLDKGADVNAMGGGNTALMSACENGYRAVVELLLQRGADVNRSGSSTALHKVASKGYAGIAELLLQRGAKPDVFSSMKETPLHVAVNNSFVEIVELLLKAGADTTLSNSAGATALHIAASRGNTNIATQLLDKGAQTNAEDSEGRTPLFNGLNGLQPLGMVRLLLARGANVNHRHIIKRQGYQTESHHLLIDAIAAGQREIVDAMLAAKADLSVVHQGLTPLMVSVRSDRVDIVEKLLRAGADPNQDTKSESPPLFYAASAGLSQAAPIVMALLKHGADPNLVNRNVQTPLVVASQPEILQLLLDYKADPNKGNPLPELLRRRNPTPQFSAVPVIQPGGYSTPSKPSDYPSVEVLLKGGANPNGTFADGTRLLSWAVPANDGKLVDLLLKYGAEVNYVANNETPLSTAQRNVQSARLSRSSAQVIEEAEHIEKALREHGANEYLQRLSSISYTRPNWTGSDGKTVFSRGTNDYNRHTLFEMLAVVFTANDQPAYPDFSRVTIERLEGVNPKRKEVALNIDELIRKGDCSNNSWLEWGDRLSFPETDHPLNEVWRGLPDETREVLSKCLERRVSIIVKQETNVVRLVQNWNLQSVGYGGISLQPVYPGTLVAQPLRPPQLNAQSVTKNPDKSLSAFRLKEVVYGANVLRASSDVMRVRVIREEDGKRKEWTFDLNRAATTAEWYSGNPREGRLPPWEDLWLREGDVIEIPEKL